jgi:hypothetical protein
VDFKKAKSLLQEEELGCRKRVLRRLQYCDENDSITVKVIIGDFCSLDRYINSNISSNQMLLGPRRL